MRHACEDLRLMGAHPEHPRQDVLLVREAAGFLVEVLLIDALLQKLDLFDGAGVVLLDRVPDRSTIFIQHDDRGDHAGHADAGCASRGFRVALGKLPEGLLRVLPPFVHIFLRPACVQGNEVVRSAGFIHQIAIPGDQDGLYRGGSDVNSKNETFHMRLLSEKGLFTTLKITRQPYYVNDFIKSLL